MLSNPPFGVDWKKAQKFIKDEYDNKGYAGRFGAGLPSISDGSLLFLQHMISKMKQNGKSGSRLAIVFNGSPLFSGGAGSGPSNIRKWIIENDWLEAIIALPDQLFYNTGIATYFWIVTNRKSPERKGKIQLINVTGGDWEEGDKNNPFYIKMMRSLGNKRKEIGDGKDGKPDQIKKITEIYESFDEGPYCKIFDNEDFGYRRICVERPKRNEKEEIEKDKNDNPIPDSELRDYENVLLKEDVEEYFKREVLPHLPDAWIDHGKTKIGYEINFTKYFYKYKPLRSLEEIRKDILALEEETGGMIKEVIEI
jgi:type I restriction enzyme M protein